MQPLFRIFFLQVLIGFSLFIQTFIGVYQLYNFCFVNLNKKQFILWSSVCAAINLTTAFFYLDKQKSKQKIFILIGVLDVLQCILIIVILFLLENAHHSHQQYQQQQEDSNSSNKLHTNYLLTGDKSNKQSLSHSYQYLASILVIIKIVFIGVLISKLFRFDTKQKEKFVLKQEEEAVGKAYEKNNQIEIQKQQNNESKENRNSKKTKLNSTLKKDKSKKSVQKQKQDNLSASSQLDENQSILSYTHENQNNSLNSIKISNHQISSQSLENKNLNSKNHNSKFKKPAGEVEKRFDLSGQQLKPLIQVADQDQLQNEVKEQFLNLNSSDQQEDSKEQISSIQITNPQPITDHINQSNFQNSNCLFHKKISLSECSQNQITQTEDNPVNKQSLTYSLQNQKNTLVDQSIMPSILLPINEDQLTTLNSEQPKTNQICETNKQKKQMRSSTTLASSSNELSSCEISSPILNEKQSLVVVQEKKASQFIENHGIKVQKNDKNCQLQKKKNNNNNQFEQEILQKQHKSQQQQQSEVINALNISKQTQQVIGISPSNIQSNQSNLSLPPKNLDIPSSQSQPECNSSNNKICSNSINSGMSFLSANQEEFDSSTNDESNFTSINSNYSSSSRMLSCEQSKVGIRRFKKQNSFQQTNNSKQIIATQSSQDLQCHANNTDIIRSEFNVDDKPQQQKRSSSLQKVSFLKQQQQQLQIQPLQIAGAEQDVKSSSQKCFEQLLQMNQTQTSNYHVSIFHSLATKNNNNNYHQETTLKSPFLKEDSYEHEFIHNNNSNNINNDNQQESEYYHINRGKDDEDDNDDDDDDDESQDDSDSDEDSNSHFEGCSYNVDNNFIQKGNCLREYTKQKTENIFELDSELNRLREQDVVPLGKQNEIECDANTQMQQEIEEAAKKKRKKKKTQQQKKKRRNLRKMKKKIEKSLSEQQNQNNQPEQNNVNQNKEKKENRQSKQKNKIPSSLPDWNKKQEQWHNSNLQLKRMLDEHLLEYFTIQLNLTSGVTLNIYITDFHQFDAQFDMQSLTYGIDASIVLDSKINFVYQILGQQLYPEMNPFFLSLLYSYSLLKNPLDISSTQQAQEFAELFFASIDLYQQQSLQGRITQKNEQHIHTSSEGSDSRSAEDCYQSEQLPTKPKIYQHQLHSP